MKSSETSVAAAISFRSRLPERLGYAALAAVGFVVGTGVMWLLTVTARHGDADLLVAGIVGVSLAAASVAIQAARANARAIASLYAQSRVWGAQHAHRPPSSDDQRLAFVGTMLDELIVDNRRLSQTARQISGSVAHELARPMVNILRYLDQENNVCTNCLPVFDEIYDRVSNIHELFIRILDITRMSEASDFNFVDLADILRESISLCGEDIEAADLIIDTEIIPAPVLGEYWLLISAVTNILANAIRFSPRSARLRICSGQKDAASFVLVEDAGPGLSDTSLESLLARLRRLRDEDRDYEVNHGFGLRLVQATAALHGAGITLGRSDLGGLAFRMKFSAVVPTAGGGRPL